MKNHQRLRRARSVFTICILSQITSTAALSLFRRDVCSSNPDLLACPSDVPFCCAPQSECIPIAATNNTAVICCPVGTGSTCEEIAPIDCDIEAQDQDQNPLNAVHTSWLNATLITCATGCCPLGYKCTGERCQREPDDHTDWEIPTSPTQTPTISSPAATSEASSATAADTKAPVHLPDKIPQSPHGQHSDPAFPAGAVLLGLFLGLAAGAAVMYLVLLVLRRRKQRNRKQSQYLYNAPETHEKGHYTKGSLQNTFGVRYHSRCVSDPVVAQEHGATHRTDFLLRPDKLDSEPTSNTWKDESHTHTSSLYPPPLNPAPAMTKNTQPTQSSNSKSIRHIFKVGLGLPLTPRPGQHQQQHHPNPTHKQDPRPNPHRPPRSDELPSTRFPVNPSPLATTLSPSTIVNTRSTTGPHEPGALLPAASFLHEDKERDPGPDNPHIERQDTDSTRFSVSSNGSSESGSRGHGRHDSAETINVLIAPEDTPRGAIQAGRAVDPQTGSPNGGDGAAMHKGREVSRMTTMSGLMESAGLKGRGEGYLGYPGRWSFKK